MPSYNFGAFFCPRVESGELLQTIRRTRRRPTREGDMLYLIGDPYREHRLLRETPCLRVLPLEIHWDFVVVGAQRLSRKAANAFARSDGFDNFTAFRSHWATTQGLSPTHPVLGFEIIQWGPKTQTSS
jgi:hypothetical protein